LETSLKVLDINHNPVVIPPKAEINKVMFHSVFWRFFCVRTDSADLFCEEILRKMKPKNFVFCFSSCIRYPNKFIDYILYINVLY
jgi:hypothetical protein